jgi:hypothetical protein
MWSSVMITIGGVGPVCDLSNSSDIPRVLDLSSIRILLELPNFYDILPSQQKVPADLIPISDAPEA